MASSSRTRLYASLVRRGFHSLVLLGAADEDALELTHSFPLAQRHVHSLSLRCCAVTDRGLEALLDHLQVKYRSFRSRYRTGIYYVPESYESYTTWYDSTINKDNRLRYMYDVQLYYNVLLLTNLRWLSHNKLKIQRPLYQ